MLIVEVERNDAGLWCATVPELPGATATDADRRAALAKAEALALRALADRLERGERAPALSTLFSEPDTDPFAVFDRFRCYEGPFDRAACHDR